MSDCDWMHSIIRSYREQHEKSHAEFVAVVKEKIKELEYECTGWARTVEQLHGQLSSDKEDAERYRWLRDPKTDVALVLDKRTGYVPPDENIAGVGGYHTYEYRAGEELDAAIDAAMQSDKEST